ncbi:MAG: hypothetical protein QXU32_11365 [Nitrososphaerales archaeon]
MNNCRVSSLKLKITEMSERLPIVLKWGEAKCGLSTNAGLIGHVWSGLGLSDPS